MRSFWHCIQVATFQLRLLKKGKQNWDLKDLKRRLTGLTLEHAMFLTFEMGQIQQIECMVKAKVKALEYKNW